MVTLGAPHASPPATVPDQVKLDYQHIGLQPPPHMVAASPTHIGLRPPLHRVAACNAHGATIWEQTRGTIPNVNRRAPGAYYASNSTFYITVTSNRVVKP